MYVSRNGFFIAPTSIKRDFFPSFPDNAFFGYDAHNLKKMHKRTNNAYKTIKVFNDFWRA